MVFDFLQKNKKLTEVLKTTKQKKTNCFKIIKKIFALCNKKYYYCSKDKKVLISFRKEK